MGADIRNVLQQQLDALNELYDKNFEAVKQLQATLLDEILPGLVDEQGWDEAQIEDATEWLEDTRTFHSVRPPSMLKYMKAVRLASNDLPYTEGAHSHAEPITIVFLIFPTAP